MKKINSNVVKSVSVVLAGSVLASSCSGYLVEGNIYGDPTENAERGKLLFNCIEIGLKDEVIRRAEAINELIQGMVENPFLAKEFAQDPDAYMSRFIATRSFSEDMAIRLDQNEKIILSALADDDIRFAAEKGDLETFLQLTQERGYLGLFKEVGNNMEDMRQLFSSDDDFNRFMQEFEQNPNWDILEGDPFLWSPVFYIPFYVVAAVALYVVGGTLFGVAVGLVYTVGVATKTNAKGGGISAAENLEYLINSSEPILKLWTDFNNSVYVTDQVLYDKLISDQTKVITNVLTKEFKDVSSNDVEAIVKTNLEGYYGFR